MSPRSYSLWLQPAGALNERLQKEILYFADAYGGPVFEPHVTLVPGFEAASDADAIEAARKVAKHLKKYKVRFAEPTYGSLYHQCVYILCQTDPAVLEANATARQLLGVATSSPYMPHLSLLYSDIDERIRRSAAELASQRLVQVYNGLEEGFDVASLTVWCTEPEDRSLKTWTKLEELPLQG